MGRTFGITYFNNLYNLEGEYFELPIEELKKMLTRKYEIKYKNNAPGFIAGSLEDNSRALEKKVINRSCLTIDFDHIKDLNEWYDAFKSLFGGITYILYTSFSHSDKEAKIRVVVPLATDIPSGQYEDFITNVFVYSLNKVIASTIDNTTHQAKRFMYCHSSPISGGGFSEYNEGTLLDVAWYPYGERSIDKKVGEYKELEVLYSDYKEAIEYFNKKYEGNAIYSSIKDEEYIEIFNSIDMLWILKNKLSKIYVANYKNRYRYVNSSSGVYGAVVYNNVLYSNHDSDPACNGHTHGNFSLLRIHLCDNSYVAAINHVKRLLNYKFYE